MERCITLALNGTGYVSPNPLVGCIIVKDDIILSEGYHHKYGEAHAERDAINKANEKNIDLTGATLYVNLEPCSHTGKTGSCAELIVKNKLAKVIIGMQDPYHEVNGKGLQILQDNNIEVETGVLEEKCKELNKFFIKFVTQHLPYVTLKVAQTLDGKIALSNYESKWITGVTSRKYVRELRDMHDCVLVGYNTALKDNPSLNVKYAEGRTPYRIIIDEKLMLPNDLNVFNDVDRERTIVFTKSLNVNPKVRTINIEDNFSMESILKELYKLEFNSVLVEGGSGIFSDFIENDLADELILFIAPKIAGKGITMSEKFRIDSLNNVKKLKLEKISNSGEDILLTYKFTYKFNR